MVCLGLEPWAAVWKAQTNLLSYGGTVLLSSFSHRKSNDQLITPSSQPAGQTFSTLTPASFSSCMGSFGRKNNLPKWHEHCKRSDK